MLKFDGEKLAEWAFTALLAQTSYFKVRRQLLERLRKIADVKGDYEMDKEDFQSIRSYLTHKQGALSDDVKLAFDAALLKIQDDVGLRTVSPKNEGKESDGESGEASATVTPKGAKASGGKSEKDSKSKSD